MNHDFIRSLPRRVAAIAALAALALPALAAGTIDKVREGGKLTIGYTTDARPFSYDEGGKPAGFAVDVCSKVAETIKAELKLPALAADFVAIKRADAFKAVEQGQVDLLCGAAPSLERRALVDFSIPVLLSGTTAAVRADAPVRLVQVLSGREPVDRPTWRGSTDQAPQRAVLATVAGTPLEKRLAQRLKERRIVADVVSVPDLAAGVQLLADRKADALFGDRTLLVDAVARSAKPADVVVGEHLFQRDPIGLALKRGDADFHLLVDRALTRLYRSPDLATIYTRHYGAPTRGALEFYQTAALPD
jgi:polar amino acid transport system substrate-binding protein